VLETNNKDQNRNFNLNRELIFDLLKRYKIHIGLFLVAFIMRIATMTFVRGDDPIFYYLGAKNILEGNGYTAFGGPIQYPMGQSLLIIPFFLIFGFTSEAAVLCSAFFGAASIVFFYVIVKNWTGNNVKIALFAACGMTFSFIHWRYSTGVWSDMSGLFLITLAIYLAMKFIRSEKPIWIYCFYFVFGFSILVRYTNAFGIIIIMIMLVYSKKLYLLKTKEVWLGLIILFISVLPQLMYNLANFDSILATGYTTEVNINRYYVHPKYPGPLYSLDYIPEGISWGAQWIFLDFYFLTPVLTPFYAIGLWALWRKKDWDKIMFALAWFFVFFIAFAVNGAHGFASLHQLIPVLPPLLFLAGVGFFTVCEKCQPFVELDEDKKANRDKGSRKVKKTDKAKLKQLKFQPVNFLIIISILLLIFTPMVVYGWIGIQYRNNEHQTRLDAILWVKDQTDEDDMIIVGQRFAGFRYYSERFTISLMGWETQNFTHPDNLNPFDVYDTADLNYEITSHDQVYILIEVTEPNMFINSSRGRELDRMYGIENDAPIKTFITKLPEDYGLAELMESIGFEDPLEAEIWEVYRLEKN